jgi:serine O-acetyltransferase
MASRGGPTPLGTAVGLGELIRGDMAAWQAVWAGSQPWEHVPCSRSAGLRFLWAYAGLRATTLYRVSHALYRHRVPVLPQLVAQVNLSFHGLDIPPHVVIGARLYIPHPVGTVITAEWIGSGVTLVSNITIGMRSTHAFPRIGDRVFIGAGARILGHVRIGDDASIGANAVVLEDVPESSVAVGVPARIRPRRTPPAADGLLESGL